MHKFFYFFLILITVPASAQSQNSYSPQKKYANDELIEDLIYLEKAITKNHPEFYISVYKDSISKKRNEKNALKAIPFVNRIYALKSKIQEKDSLQEIEFYRQIAELNFSIKCVHTDIRPPDNFDNWWKKEASLVPFNVIKNRGKFYIYQNYSNTDSLSFGSKILSINNYNIYNLNKEFILRIPSDGNNKTRIWYALRKGFYRYYSYYIQYSAPTYTVKYIPFGDTIERTTTVKGISKQTLDEKRKALDKTTPPISHTYIDSLNTVVLTIPTFRNDLFEKAEINFSNYLDSVFSTINKKKTKHLIIDLRANGGGYSEYGAQLLSYLTDTAYEYCRNMWLATDKLSPDIEYDIPETFKGFPNGIVKENGGYKWKNHSVLGWRQPAKNNFKGKVYFLIDGGGVSTTSEVASIAKENKMGVFIGEEVGGKYAGDNGGVLGWVELPNTKIKVRIALVEYELAVTGDNEGYGVRPDYGAYTKIEDIVLNKDKAMELAISLIRKEKN